MDKSRRLFKELFAADLLTRSPEARRKLAEKLIEEAKKSSDVLPDQFVLLVGASEAAREAQDLEEAGRAADAIAAVFLVDGLRMRVDAALSILGTRGPSPVSDVTCTAALKLIDELLRDEDYASAAKVLAVLRPVISAVHPALVPMGNRRAKDLDAGRSASERAMPLADKLKAFPDDPAANYVVGSFLCFYRQDWARGLPMLAKSSEARLKSLASSDLAAPRDAESLAQLGDSWWNMGTTLSEPARQHVLAHAATLYQPALSGSVGLRRSVIQKRIAEVSRADQPAVIDLMPLIDPSRDTITGVWKLEGGNLTSDNAASARLKIRFRPPEEYDFRITFVRLEGNEDVTQLLSHGNSSFAWAMGTFDNKCAMVESSADHKVWFDHLFTNGQVNESIVKVRRDSIATYINGKLATEFKTDYGDFHVGAWGGAEGLLGVASWRSPTRFETIEVIEVTGHGVLNPKH